MPQPSIRRQRLMSLSCEPGVYDDAVLIDRRPPTMAVSCCSSNHLVPPTTSALVKPPSLRQNDHIVDIHRKHPAERLPIVMSFYLPGVATTVCAG